MKSLSQLYPIWFVDIWGVIHNGVAPFALTLATLAQHRAAGGRVVLVSNSPRSGAGVVSQLDQIGVRRDCYDAVVTSGDVTQDLMRNEPTHKLFHIGPTRDVSLFEGLPVERVAEEEAGAIICTGLFHDDRETPEDYVPLLQALHKRRLPMICANPDKQVRKGSRLLYCAGALAELYQNMGGVVSMAGKPFQPIYDLALRTATQIAGKPVERSQVLAIGDGPETDILGAANQGFPVVYVAGGVREKAADLEEELKFVKSLVPKARVLRAVHQLTWS